ncbi:MAG TPA: hypothetical protein HPP56_06570, partial [Nitrospirae bacterium]|nr:hypothetical protein [Nitrospirota bacterium]
YFKPHKAKGRYNRGHLRERTHNIWNIVLKKLCNRPRLNEYFALRMEKGRREFDIEAVVFYIVSRHLHGIRQ